MSTSNVGLDPRGYVIKGGVREVTPNPPPDPILIDMVHPWGTFGEDPVMIVDTGWRCVICYQVAQCWCIDVCLCIEHAKEYNFGFGKSLKQMKEKYEQK